jgi:hypothetical protein
LHNIAALCFNIQIPADICRAQVQVTALFSQ